MAVQGQYARNKKFRNRNVNANIDQTLFASKKPSTGGRTVVNQSFLASLGASGVNPADTVTISMDELRNIHRASIQISAAERAKQDQLRQSATQSTLMKAEQRKSKMLKMEEERKKRNAAGKNVAARKESNAMLSHARQAMDEQLDDVKAMNQMMLYAKCVTIRDAQIREKQRIKINEMDEEKRQDMAMELERIKTLKMYEDRERLRQEEQRVGAQVIIKQIQEREADRIRQQELVDQEAQSMVHRIKELEMMEEDAKTNKMVAGRKMLQEVMETNNQQVRAKLNKKQQELEEELRIQAYVRAKEAREALKDAEVKRKRKEKEEEVARLGSMQARSQDRQSELDELRAKRYQEAKDREWRASQVGAAQKQQRLREDVAASREYQRLEKAQRMAEQALQEREEYQRVLEWQRSQAEQDQDRVRETKASASMYREGLKGQISEREKQKAIDRQRFLAEGEQMAAQMSMEKDKLLRIKQQKLGTLEAAGVPVKYRAELAKKKVMVSTIHQLN